MFWLSYALISKIKKPNQKTIFFCHCMYKLAFYEGA